MVVKMRIFIICGGLGVRVNNDPYDNCILYHVFTILYQLHWQVIHLALPRMDWTHIPVANISYCCRLFFSYWRADPYASWTGALQVVLVEEEVQAYIPISLRSYFTLGSRISKGNLWVYASVMFWPSWFRNFRRRPCWSRIDQLAISDIQITNATNLAKSRKL